MKIPFLDTFTFKSGIKKKNTDLLLVTLPKNSLISGVFTKSKTASASVNYCIKNLENKKKSVRVILVNSGNSNTFTGEKGKECVKSLISYLADKYKCSKHEVFTASTGVIGEFLDPNKIIKCLNENKYYSNNSWIEASKSIMTTDTFPKLSRSVCKVDDKKIDIVGIAKGSGMIAPNMATMLAFIFTNANISSYVLQSLLEKINEKTFNSITVDNDTSTSDTVLLVSVNDEKKRKIENINDKQLKHFKRSLYFVMLDLAKQIVRDGEGATKFIHVKIKNATSKKSAKKIGLSIANSPLVKTAIAGEDANWGRIIMAIGKSYEKINTEKIKIFFGKHQVTDKGMKYSYYKEDVVSKYLKNKEIEITVDIGTGKQCWSIYTCDFTSEYIKINADYRS